MSIQLIHHFLQNSAARFPDKTAVIHDTRRVSYNEVLQKAIKLASYLKATGVNKGDRIILIHENSDTYVSLYYGILMAGGIVVPLNPNTQPDGLLPLFADLLPTVIIASEKGATNIFNVSNLPNSIRNIILSKCCSATIKPFPVPVIMLDDLPPATGNFNDATFDENDLATIIYTSGSTGKPKGVMLTHGNVVANTRSICTYLELTERDIQMVVLPFFYVMGKSLLNTHIAVGGTVIINNKFSYPAAVVEQMITEKVTGFSGVPSTYAYLLHRSPLVASRDKLTSLRYVSQAGGHMAKQVKLALREALPEKTKIIVMYGATEAAARLTWLDPNYFLNKIDSIGKAIPDVTISIVDPYGNEVKDYEIGEITASGNNIMRGYWKNDEASKQVLDHNGYHTGDMGYKDSDGYIYVTGRRDNQLKVGGHRVDPQEIEDSIMTSGLLIELTVIGIPDQLMGNKLFCIAVPVNDTSTETDILAFASKTLPKHKVPTRILFIKSLPKNANGKVDRVICGKIIAERLAF